MSLVDRLIGVFAPRAALRNAVARQSLEMLSKRSAPAYEAASKGQRFGGWVSPSSSADTVIAASAETLRARMSDMVRNNAYSAKAVSSLVANIVGDGIVPRAATGSAQDEAINALFHEWSRQCDADGHLDFYGIQTLMCREMIERGEVLLRRRWRRASDGLRVPMQVQVLEADFLDTSVTAPSKAGGEVKSGIEFDAIGRRRGYWMHAVHPGDSHRLTVGRTSKFVPASEVIHLFEKQRTQIRGVPWGTPAIPALRDLDNYEIAEARRKEMEACIVGVVIGDEENDFRATTDPRVGVGTVHDADGLIVERMEPGMFPVLRNGKDIKFNQPATTGGYPEYKRTELHKVAAGFRLPYELLTGDLSGVNYSSIRAGLVEFKKVVTSAQWQLLIPVACEPMWRWFSEAAWGVGLVPAPEIPVKWATPKWVSPDPLKDAAADLIATRMGSMTLAEVIASRGEDWQDVFKEHAAVFKAIDEAGFVFDCDPRQVNKAGAMQPDAVGMANKVLESAATDDGADDGADDEEAADDA